MISENKPEFTLTLGYCRTQFLITLSTEERSSYQQEIQKFVVWFNENSQVEKLTIPAVANYAEQISSAAKLEPVKAFLKHLHSKGLVKDKLHLHIKAKKTASKKDQTPAKVASKSTRSAQQAIELTQTGYDKLQQEIADLKEERPHIVEEIRKAAADKDFRENAPLEAAREQLGKTESRIRELEATLKQATVMDSKSVKGKQITIGDTVIVCDISTGEHITYTLVDARESKPSAGKISTASPIGKALSGCSKGDEITFSTPAGSISYRIEDIKHA